MPSAAGKPGQLSDSKENKASKAPEGYSYAYSSHIVVWSLDNTREGGGGKTKGGSEYLPVSAIVSS